MVKEINHTLIDEIVQLSKDSNETLQNHIHELIKLYTDQTQEYKKVVKENDFFLKKWDQRNILVEEKNFKKDEILEQQSHFTAMGEMIDAVAHKWKQPLAAITLAMEVLKDEFKNENVTQAYLQKADETINLQIEHMTSTLNEFRSFLQPSIKNEIFYVKEALDNMKILLKDELISQSVNIVLDVDNSVKIEGNKNELIHLFINLINNSIDAFKERNIEKRDIFIRCYNENNRTYIEVEDNAGGVPEEIIEVIFNPKVTTKQNNKGSGIGLYMSSQIVKKNQGLINVFNSDKGAFFTITLLHHNI